MNFIQTKEKVLFKDQTKIKKYKQELITKATVKKPAQTNKNDDLSKEIKRLKKQNEQFNSNNNKLLHKIILLEKEKIQLSNRMKERNKVVKTLKKEVSEKEKEIRQLNNLVSQLDQKHQNAIKQLNEIVMEQQNKINSLESKIIFFKDGEMYKELNKYESMINNADRIIKAKEKKIERFRSKYVKAHNEVQTLKNETAKLIKQINSYNQTEHHLQKEIEKIRISALGEYEVEKILDFLFENMKVKNIHNYRKINKLKNKFDHLIKYKREIDREINTNRSFSDWQEKLGFIGQDNVGEWWFIDLENTSYYITASLPQNLTDDLPAKAVINEGSAFLLYVWYKENEIPEEIAKTFIIKPEDVNGFDKEVDYEYIGNFSVAVITSLNGSKYERRLKKHGINAFWLDSYEKSPVHVREIMEKSDIVIMYPDSMQHYILDLIEDRSLPKYQFMKNNNEISLVVRTRFAAVQLGLI